MPAPQQPTAAIGVEGAFRRSAGERWGSAESSHLVD